MATNYTPRSQEEIKTSPSVVPQETNTKALLKGFQKVVVAGILASSVNMSNAEPASSTSFVVNSAYETIIADAEKAGQNPTDYAISLKNSGKMTFAEVRAFNKYFGEKGAIEDQKEQDNINNNIANIKQEIAELKRKTLENTIETSKLEEEEIKKYRQIIHAIEWLEKSGQVTAAHYTRINEIYSNKIVPEDLKEEIRKKFAKHLGIVIAQNT